jgi:lysozyme
MSAVEIALPRLETEEGFRSTVYRDTNGLQTIGFGFCVDRGISRNAAAALLDAQVMELHTALLQYQWYAALDDNRQSVCLDIATNQGLHGLLNYPHMLAALAAHDWQVAASECTVKDPLLSARYAALAQILLTGSV